MGYREILKAELKKRKSLSPKYSLRDFAKDLGFSPAHLCYVLQGKRGISGEKAQKISNALGFKNVMSRSFRYLVLSSSARSRVGKLMAAQALLNPVFFRCLSKFQAICHEKHQWVDQVQLLKLKNRSQEAREQYGRFMLRLDSCKLLNH